ncbi:helix-turn-helix transcriptional regulator [Sphingosinicella terrae]|uniref:helix-turn-helix transcriptional regulator n=1 Tax=Sphingosinicella terrae TaxID=2172047 RepID=UPI0013B3ADE2|nr:LuxR family transcriptional regulator [Sphingosinicella terrae]
MPSRLERVQAFAESASTIASGAELHLLLDETVRDFGADYFLMIHHADFSTAPAGLVRIGNYPLEFISISRQDGRPLHDPIMDACERTLAGFFWDEVWSIVTPTERNRRRAAAVAQSGLGDGFVVPTHIPGEHLGSCHFAVRAGRHLPRENSAALQAIAAFGFEAARRLAGEAKAPLRRGAPLTDRQRECIILCAQGKSDSVIAQLLGLSHKTVNAYVEAAKRRYGVATRGQLIVRALYASDITFHDIVGPPSAGRGPAACN